MAVAFVSLAAAASASATPVVTSISPTHGLTTGGTSVLISGTGFVEEGRGGAVPACWVCQVDFGSVEAESFELRSNPPQLGGGYYIAAISPPGLGTVDITVHGPLGTSATSPADQFTYVEPPPPPTVTGVEPASGPTTGGSTVTITGTHFREVRAVKFGSAEAGFTVNSEGSLTATAPPGSGVVDVTVNTLGGTSPANAGDRYTYVTPVPVITAVGLNHGPTKGGGWVTIEGTGLSGVSEVHFGSTPATEIADETANRLSARAPAGTGTVDITVTVPGGLTSQITPADQYTYFANELVEYNGWIISGTITDKKLEQSIVLPGGAKFDGTGEINEETGAGFVSGSFSVPRFQVVLKPFGPIIPVTFGMTITESEAVFGGETGSGFEPIDLNFPFSFNLGVTSVGLLGLRIPTSCTTGWPVLFALEEFLSREAVLHKGWSFSGEATLPPFRCENGLLGWMFGQILTETLSGDGNTYSLSFTAPSH
jgi:hypothetical protein